MAERTKITVVDGGAGVWAERLREPGFDITSADTASGEHRAGQATPDLVLIDGRHRPDVVGDVRACRRRWPAATLPVLVLGLTDPQLGSAAIEAGATDAVVGSTHGPTLNAHVRRLLRSGERLRGLLEAERRTARREGLALAAADVAVPLGEMVDRLEAAMTSRPSDVGLEELLDLAVRAVDAVDRLRRLAQQRDTPAAERDAEG